MPCGLLDGQVLVVGLVVAVVALVVALVVGLDEIKWEPSG